MRTGVCVCLLLSEGTNWYLKVPTGGFGMPTVV